MSDSYLTQAAFDGFQANFEAFQRKLDRQFEAVAKSFATVNGRLDAFEKRVDERFDDVAGQFDAFGHRLLKIEDEYLSITEALKRLEGKADRVEIAVQRLDERLSRVEKRLEELVTADPRYALRSDVQDLKHRLAALHQRFDELEKRMDRT